MTSNGWVLVADAARAQLYAHGAGDDLVLVREFSHPQSRLKGHDVLTDRPGRLQGANSGHGAEEPGAAKQHELENFAAELAQALERGRTEHAYEHLVIAAPAHFHGILTQHLSAPVRETVRANIEKDYTQLPVKDLRSRLAEHLRHTV